jgi:hypothetical protein
MNGFQAFDFGGTYVPEAVMELDRSRTGKIEQSLGHAHSVASIPSLPSAKSSDRACDPDGARSWCRLVSLG